MSEPLQFFKIDETSVYGDGYIYSFYRDLAPSKSSDDSPQWLASFHCSLKNQKGCHGRIHTTAHFVTDKRGRKFQWGIVRNGDHNHEPEHRDTTRTFKFFKDDESVIRNGYTYAFYRELDPPKPSGDFHWRMSYHCPVTVNNQESCAARIYTAGNWMTDKRGNEFQWGMFKNCEHRHEIQQVSTIAQVIMGEDTYKCSICSYSNSRSVNVTVHLRTHTGEKPYKCELCSYAGATTGHLKYHMRTHTGEKPHKCPQCSYATTTSGALASHMCTHTGEKTYKCGECTYAASTSSALKRHTRTHTGEKPYKCKLCSYASTDYSALQRHIRAHSGEKSFKCAQCSYASTRKTRLNQHVCTHHSLRKK